MKYISVLACCIKWLPVAVGFGVPTEPETRLCALSSFVPFTYDEGPGTSTSLDDGEFGDTSNLGFSHMAAALMAMQHFNERNSVVVPELDDLDCPVQFSMENSKFFDSGIFSHVSTVALRDEIVENGIPCAIAGPHDDLPAQLLGVFATGLQIPLVAYRAQNARITTPYHAPFSNVVYPNLIDMAAVLVSYLKHIGRDNFVAVLYSVLDTNIQRQEVVSLAFEDADIRFRRYPFVFATNELVYEELVQLLSRLKREGYKTIVNLLEFPEQELPFLARAAEEAGVNGPDYFWVFLGVDISAFSLPPVFPTATLLRLIAGGAILTPLEGFQVDPLNDKFSRAWWSNDATFVDTVNTYMSIDEGSCGHHQADPAYFQRPPASGSGFMYDAVMSIGLGGCAALFNETSHLEGVRSVKFNGATGLVQLGNGDVSPGGRNSSTVNFGVINLFHVFTQMGEEQWEQLLNDTCPEPNECLELFQITAKLEAGGSIVDAKWKTLNEFLYRSGKTQPPKLLRDIPEQNHLSQSIRIIGLFLMSCTLVAAVAASVWVYMRRTHAVVRKTQPYSLYLVCLGSFIMTWGVYPISFDESYGWNKKQLDLGCMSVCWLVCIGHALTYGALFSKLWRLNKVLQFRRTTVKLSHMLAPMVAFFLAGIVVLSLMTVFSPLKWERIEIDAISGESIARCGCEHMAAFVFPLAIVLFMPVVLTAFMAWKTLDVDEAYSDGRWVFALILVQMEMVVIGVPVTSILRDVDTDGRYFGTVAMLLTFPLSALLLIIVPKIFAYRRAQNRQTKSIRGGSSGAVRVTGIELPRNNDSRYSYTDTQKDSMNRGGANSSEPMCDAADE